MPFRDEREALRSRAEALEMELRLREAEHAELSQRTAEAKQLRARIDVLERELAQLRSASPVHARGPESRYDGRTPWFVFLLAGGSIGMLVGALAASEGEPDAPWRIGGGIVLGIATGAVLWLTRRRRAPP